MHNHSPAKARSKLEEACAQPQPSIEKTKTGGSLCITTAKLRQDPDRGKPERNHSLAEERSRPGEAYAPPQPIQSKTETRGSLLALLGFGFAGCPSLGFAFLGCGYA